MTHHPRAILYARYSTDMQNPASVEDQFRKCREYADRQGWRVVEEVFDREISGSCRDRPGFHALQRLLRDGHCDVVLAESLDRLSRDQEHTAAFYKQVRFANAALHTVARGKIDAIQIGLGSTMAALYLEDLADKTRRGLEGRVLEGKSGGGLSYGYKTATDEQGQRKIGEVAIDDLQAVVVRRIFAEYAEGRSPLKIAAGLNADGIPAPRGRSAGSGHWKQNTINGNRERGTGILNNELYIGRRVWNRLRYVKDPATDRRVSRLNDLADWKVVEVPNLRIVDQDLWDAVKARQDKARRVRAKKDTTDRNGLSGSQALRRRRYLLSGLLVCGCCGGRMTVAGTGAHKRYYCANAKEKGAAVCSGLPGLKERAATETVLSCLRNGLMTDAAYDEFRARVTEHLSASQGEAKERLRAHDARVRELEKTHANLLKAVEGGKHSDAIIDRLNAVDAELKEMKTRRGEIVPAPLDLPDDLPERYRAYVDDLVATLSEEQVVGRAADAIEELIERIVVSHDPIQGHTLDIQGNLAAMLKAANPAGGGVYEASRSSLKLVAGVGFEPTTFRL